MAAGRRSDGSTLTAAPCADLTQYFATRATSEHLRPAGVPGATVRHFPTTGQKQAVALYAERGMMLRDVTEYIDWYFTSGMPQISAVQQVLRDVGVPTRPNGPQPRARRHG